MEKDILVDIPDEDLPLLSELYKDHVAVAPQVYSFLNTCIQWKKKKPNGNLLTVMGVNNDWFETGAFIILMQYTCYDIFLFSLEDDGYSLYKGLSQTKRIDWSNRMVWYAVSSKHCPIVRDVVKYINLPLNHFTDTGMFVMEREKALQLEIQIPVDVYIAKLNKSHSELVNSLWPHRYENSENYLGTFIEMNDCYGIFLKSDDSLVSWILKNHMGQLGILQTVPGHLRKGYGTLITKYLAKKIAEEGHNPLGTVVVGNKASETMFSRMGFQSIDICTYFVT